MGYLAAVFLDRLMQGRGPQQIERAFWIVVGVLVATIVTAALL